MSEYEPTEEQKEALERLKKKTTLNIKVDTDEVKRILEKNIELEKGSKEFEKFRAVVLHKARKVLSEEEIESLGDNTTFSGVTSVAHKALEREKWLREDENRESPSGVTTLNPNQLGDTSKGYNSLEEMIDDLHRMEHSDNLEAKKYANQVLNELFRKSFDSIKKGELGRPIVYEPKEGKSIVRKVLDEQNERMRRKILKSRGEKDEN